MSISKFSVYWNVQNAGKYTGVPVLQPTRNDLDAHGAFLDLKRLPAESNYDYYRRLQGVIPLRAGSEQVGLVHGITRELGLEEKVGIIITPVSSSGDWTAQSPHVEITATSVNLYSSYTDEDTNTLDTSIDIFDHGNGYLIEDVVSAIGTSEYFTASLGTRMTGKEKANGLFPGSSSSIVSQEWVPANTYFVLEHSDVIPGTLYFTEREVFGSELSSALASTISEGLSLTWAVTTTVTQAGDYFVDYKNGIVTSYRSASGRGTCRYVYRQFPWYVRWSPIAVYNLRDSDYRSKVFEDEIMNNNSTQDGLVTKEGSQVYSQVFDRSPCLWGE
jgi:hypothetical protein